MTSESGTDAEQIKPEKKKESLGEILRTVIYAILIAVGLRTVAYEPFVIPSGSMLPTLLMGDYVFVSKFSYGYSKHSMPFSPPVLSGRIFESPVKRGDVVVFKLPTDNSTDYIKRIVGLPGAGSSISIRQRKGCWDKARSMPGCCAKSSAAVFYRQETA